MGQSLTAPDPESATNLVSLPPGRYYPYIPINDNLGDPANVLYRSPAYNYRYNDTDTKINYGTLDNGKNACLDYQPAAGGKVVVSEKPCNGSPDQRVTLSVDGKFYLWGAHRYVVPAPPPNYLDYQPESTSMWKFPSDTPPLPAPTNPLSLKVPSLWTSGVFYPAGGADGSLLRTQVGVRFFSQLPGNDGQPPTPAHPLGWCPTTGRVPFVGLCRRTEGRATYANDCSTSEVSLMADRGDNWCIWTGWQSGLKEECITGAATARSSSGLLDPLKCKLMYPDVYVQEVPATVARGGSALMPGAWAPWTSDSRDSAAVLAFCSQLDTRGTPTPFYTSSTYSATCGAWCNQNRDRCNTAQAAFCSKYPMVAGCTATCLKQGCLRSLQTYCQGSHLDQPECQTFCKSDDARKQGFNCDQALTRYCASLPAADALKLARADVCGCFMPASYYENFFRVLNGRYTIGVPTPPLATCFFPYCSGPNAIKPVVFTPCPNISQCIAFTNVEISGEVKIENLKIETTGECAGKLIPVPPTPSICQDHQKLVGNICENCKPNEVSNPAKTQCATCGAKAIPNKAGNTCTACPGTLIANKAGTECVPPIGPKPSFWSEYGVYFIIGGLALLALIIIIVIAVVVSKRNARRKEGSVRHESIDV